MNLSLEMLTVKATTILAQLSAFIVGFLASFVAAVLFAFLVHKIYLRSAAQFRRSQFFARDLWWLPAWRCWRFVVRNIGGNTNLWEIQYRCWLREIVPAQVGSSVASFRDTDLSGGQRIILPVGQDLPVLCFRFEEREGELFLIHTDKFGGVLGEFRITGPNKWEVKAEYSFQTIGIGGVPHRVYRLLTIPEKAKGQHTEVDVFRRLLSHQGQSECTVPLAFTGAEQISVRYD
jgi:hypothetical protein